MFTLYKNKSCLVKAVGFVLLSCLTYDKLEIQALTMKQTKRRGVEMDGESVPLRARCVHAHGREHGTSRATTHPHTPHTWPCCASPLPPPSWWSSVHALPYTHAPYAPEAGTLPMQDAPDRLTPLPACRCAARRDR